MGSFFCFFEAYSPEGGENMGLVDSEHRLGKIAGCIYTTDCACDCKTCPKVTGIGMSGFTRPLEGSSGGDLSKFLRSDAAKRALSRAADRRQAPIR